jgi:hypothetical protein
MSQGKSTRLLQNKTGWLLFFILLFGLVLRMMFFSGMGTSDDLAYSAYAANIEKGIDPDSVLTLSTRLGIIYPTAFSYRLFGISDFSSILFVLLASLAGIILIFYFGKLLVNEKVGLMAAFLLSFFPLDVFYATKLFTDLPSAFFMALGVYVFLYSEIKSKLQYGIGYLLSGIFIGVGYLIRESVLLIAIFFAAYIVYKKTIRRKYFLVPLGILIIFIIESLIFMGITGNPLFRHSTSQEYLTKSVIDHNYFGRLDFPTGLFHYPWLFLTNNLLSFFYVFILIGIVYAGVYKKREAYAMLLWFVPIILYLAFGSSSLTQYVPFKAADRYTSLITTPGILILALFLTEKKDIVKKVVMPAALALLLVSSIGAVYLQEDSSALHDLNAMYPSLVELKKPIYLDQRSLAALDYISGYESTMVLKAYPKDLDDVKDSYIMINSDMIRRQIEVHPNAEFPHYVRNPPDSWLIIRGFDKEKIVLYYIP